MRISCPFCGERDSGEFSYLGDAGCPRPSTEDPSIDEKFFEAVYVRENPKGLHQELWYHAGGCRSWLKVWRNTVSHEISSVEFASEGASRE